MSENEKCPHCDAALVAARGESAVYACGTILRPTGFEASEKCHARWLQLVNAGEQQSESEVDCLRRQLAAQTAQLQEIDRWIKSKHNGYDPKAREVMPELHEPTTLVNALEELMGEWKCLEDMAIEKLVAAEARADAAVAEKDRLRGVVESRIRQWSDDGRTARAAGCGAQAVTCFEHVLELKSIVPALAPPTDAKETGDALWTPQLSF